MLREYTKLEQTEGRYGVGVARKAADVCIEIADEQKKRWSAGMSKMRGWRVQIDFAALPERILLMKAGLDEIITDIKAKEKYCNWDYLLEDNGGDINALHKIAEDPRRAMWSKGFLASRPG